MISVRLCSHPALLIIVFAGIGACGADPRETPHPPIEPVHIKLQQPPPALSDVPPMDTPPISSASEVPSNPEPIAPRICKTDDECYPDFCDRGICAEVGMNGKRPYGRECTPPPAPVPISQLPPLGPNEVRGLPSSVSPCGGYLCVNGRCRSCASASECASETSVCQRVPGFPGMRCGAPSAALPVVSATVSPPSPTLLMPDLKPWPGSKAGKARPLPYDFTRPPPSTAPDAGTSSK